jgi:putative addiction module killer protein
MLEVRLTPDFSSWLNELKDRRAQDRIVARLRRFEFGNLGDVKPVGHGISEARIDYGPGYRLYFVRHHSVVMILLCGGTKKSQKADIATARAMTKELGQ